MPKVRNHIGYATRKLGDVDEGIRYYHKALALDPDFSPAREYLGEGDLAKAKQQLAELAARCGTTRHEYRELAEEIAAFEAKTTAH